MASGDLLADLIPIGAYGTPTSNFATFDMEPAGAVLDFDAATDESRDWVFRIPPWYGGNGITVKVRFGAKGITSGNVIFDGQFERHDDGTDLDSDSFAAVQSSSATAVPATDGATKEATITFTNSQIDSASAGEEVRFRLNRDANNGSDTAAADVQVWSVKISET